MVLIGWFVSDIILIEEFELLSYEFSVLFSKVSEVMVFRLDIISVLY